VPFTSIFLIAIGAVLRYSAAAPVGGVSLHVAGVVLMVVGAAGLVWTLLTAVRRHQDAS
jgi:hypothetical protein